ncbi:hypothetical protein GFS24_15260 [Chitinophaga sp. SYP-B3965]|uniref:hypothetical protein n=1 Tax=Chitinophaga sp. SYP-B3965 TaxID=2663120 RepID=UPI001299F025|nr:hypothetical protein [Chitinophaga sp. SYP-B3965]MRG46480.1 hypothetical protein [Chitinophaga sp. SYP-B3965]
MRPGIFIVVAFFAGIFSIINGQRPKKLSSEAAHAIDWYGIQFRVLQKESHQFLQAVTGHKKATEIQKQFRDTRDAYKKLELFAGYFDPATAEALSGWDSITLNDTAAMRRETLQVISHIDHLGRSTDTLLSTDAQLFDAMEMEMGKMKAFETSENGVADTKGALAGVKAVWLFYQDKLDHHFSDQTRELFMEAERMLDTTKVFNENMRAKFLVQYVNPLAMNIVQTREELKIGERK